MGLDVDIYRVKIEKGKTEENYLDEVLDDEKYIETIYMRKPYLIWDDMQNILHYHHGIIEDKDIKKIKKLLQNIITNFKEIYLKYYNENEKGEDFFTYYVYNLKKYVDFYSIITNYEISKNYGNAPEYLIIDFTM